MSIKKLMACFTLCQDLINDFVIYSATLDDYFSKEENRVDNEYLYNYYLQLKTNLTNSIKKNGFDKK